MRDGRWILAVCLLAACGDDNSGRFFPPDNDASTETDVTVADVVATDIVSTDLGARDAVADRVTVTDRGPAADRPNACPSGCATQSDCVPCNELPSDLYCCVSGLCVFTTGGMCAAQPEPGPISEDGEAGTPDGSGNPIGDVPDFGDDGGMKMPPEDAPSTPMDGAAPADATAPADVVNDLAGGDGAG